MEEILKIAARYRGKLANVYRELPTGDEPEETEVVPHRQYSDLTAKEQQFLRPIEVKDRRRQVSLVWDPSAADDMITVLFDSNNLVLGYLPIHEFNKQSKLDEFVTQLTKHLTLGLYDKAQVLRLLYRSMNAEQTMKWYANQVDNPYPPEISRHLQDERRLPR